MSLVRAKGRLIDHDPKSRNYQFTSRRVRAGDTRHTLNAPHADQFYTSGCVGFSGNNLLNTTSAIWSRRAFNAQYRDWRTSKYLANEHGLVNYTGATENDPFPWVYPPTDEGSSGLGLMKFWKAIGVIGSYRWVIDGGFSAFLAALQGQPVSVGTWWYDDMFTTDNKGLIHTELSGNRGGHQYIATEIIWAPKLIGFDQSWGENPPGFRSHFYLPMDKVEALILDDGDVAVPEFRWI